MSHFKDKRLLFLPGLALVAIIALAISGHVQIANSMRTEISESVAIDAGIPTISIEMSGASDYICLSSAEYGQAYLPEAFQCHQCDMSEAASTVLDAPWNENRILLISRSGNQIHASEIDVSSISGYRINTWYKNISYYPEKAQGMSQCTLGKRALATCHRTANGCLLLFKE